jgi:hypothetical protein
MTLFRAGVETNSHSMTSPLISQTREVLYIIDSIRGEATLKHSSFFMN